MAELVIMAGYAERFTQISNDFCRDPRVTPRACKVFLYLRSNATGWQSNVRSIAKVLGMGKNTVAAAINDLEELGYVRRENVRDQQGQFSETRYLVFEEPCIKNGDTVGIHRVPKNGYPINGYPKTGTLKNTNSLRTPNDKNTNTPIVPTGDEGDDTPHTQPEWYDVPLFDEHGNPAPAPQPQTNPHTLQNDTQQPQTEETTNDTKPTKKTARNAYSPEFETFWKAYPRPEDKKRAYRAWKTKLKDGYTPDEITQILAHYQRLWQQRQTEQRYMPHCATWLNRDLRAEVEAHQQQQATAHHWQHSENPVLRMIQEQQHNQNPLNPEYIYPQQLGINR